MVTERKWAEGIDFGEEPSSRKASSPAGKRLRLGCGGDGQDPCKGGLVFGEDEHLRRVLRQACDTGRLHPDRDRKAFVFPPLEGQLFLFCRSCFHSRLEFYRRVNFSQTVVIKSIGRNPAGVYPIVKFPAN